MAIPKKLKDELKALGEGMLYFTVWFGFFSLIMDLLLTDYQISPIGVSKILIGGLVLAKVVLILEHVSLGSWEQTKPAWLGILIRTLLYSLGVLVVMLIERSFEGRQESGGFIPAFQNIFKHADIHRVLANTICASGALLVYNVLATVRSHLGSGGLWRVLRSPCEKTAD